MDEMGPCGRRRKPGFSEDTAEIEWKRLQANGQLDNVRSHIRQGLHQEAVWNS